ncbi:MAG: signal peptide peptidase SppA [Caldilineaceae bacterium]|nr:signal peptide peptidase SppA [Caldilineaceae bacterium]
MGWQTQIWQAMRAAGAAAERAWQQVVCKLSNLRRRLFHSRLPDYAVIVLDHEIAERSPDLPWWYAYIPSFKLPLSLETLHDALQRLAGDPDLKGVVLIFKGATLSLAQAQSLSALLARFHHWDGQLRSPGAPAKQVIVHLEQTNAAAYVVACAADRITLPPLVTWDVMGLRVAPTYWRETLTRAGIEFEAIQIAPWKTAVDSLTRSSMSAAEREQFSWLLDSLCDDIVSAVVQGRGLTPAQVSGLIDQAPLTADAALAAGLVDTIAYEDELPALLAVAGQPAKFKPYAQVRGLLWRRPRPRAAAGVGVLSLQGSIVVGESRSFPLPLPLLGDHLLGSNTVEQAIRAARKRSDLAAVVVHVDSGGGSALASDLIWRELRLLDQEKPVVVYLGDVAASGGYYIAVPGRKIVAQPATLTGSIGVVISKAVTQELRAKIGANREIMRRGENAGMLTDDQPWTEAQRATLEGSIRHVYERFKTVVAEGRNLPFAELDPICQGRVWTGKQALGHGLVDALGDFQVALSLACQAAGLPDDGSVETHRITPPHTWLPADPAQGVQALMRSAGREELNAWARALVQGDWPRLLGRERIWLFASDLPKIE